MRQGLTMWRHGLAGALAFLLAACGGGGSSGSAPYISNLALSPTAVYVSTSPQTFNGTLDFSDPEGNVTALNLKIRDSSGNTVDLGTTPISGISGMTSGTILGQFVATTVAPDIYTVLFQLTDATNLWSNVLSAAVRVAAFPWVSRATAPVPREYAASAELNGELYVVGGQLTDSCAPSCPTTSLVEIYSPAADSWRTGTPLPTARMGLTLTAYGGKLYAIGGHTDTFSTSAVSTVDVYDPSIGSGVWVPGSSLLFEARYDAAAAVVNVSTWGELIVVAGGQREGSYLSSVQGYDPRSDAWRPLEPMSTARSQLAMSAVNGRLYAVGGYNQFLMQPWLGAVEEYDPGSGQWSPKAPMPTARGHFAMAAINGHLLAAGGENALARSLTTLESYDPVTNVWTTKTPSSTAFTRATAGVVNNRMYVFGNGLTLQYDPANEIR